MMIQRYKHIIWDWNGTLFDDVWLCVSVINTLLNQRNLPALTIDTYQAIFMFPVREYYRKLGFNFAVDSFEELSVQFMEHYEARRNECALCQHAREVLTHIKGSDIGQSILSAYPYDGLVEVVRHFDLEPFFERLIGLGDIYATSKLDLGRNWMSELGYAKSEVLLIGDTLHDFEVAEAIGAECILVAGGHNSRERLHQCDARIVDSLQDLADT